MKKLTAIFLLAGIVCFLPALHAQQTYLGGQIGIGIPTGTFGDSYETGIGGSAQFMYNLVDEGIWVNGQIGYKVFNHSSERSDVTGSWSTIPLLGSIRYQLSKGNFRSYVGVALGMHFISRTLDTKIDEVTTTTKKARETAFGASLLGGFLYPISPTVFLDATLSYNTVLAEEVEDGPGYLGLKVGVAIPVNL